MTLQKVAKATLVTVGILVGVAAAIVVLYFAAVILVVLLGLWVAARVAGAASRMVPGPLPNAVTALLPLLGVEVERVDHRCRECRFLVIEQESHPTAEAAVIDGEDVVQIHHRVMIQTVLRSDPNFRRQISDGRGDCRDSDCPETTDGNVTCQDEDGSCLVQGGKMNRPHYSRSG